MRKVFLFSFIVLLLMTGCSSNTGAPKIEITAKVTNLTAEEFGEVGIKGLVNPSRDDFSKFSLAIKVINPGNSKVEIDMPGISEIKNCLNKDNEDRYWFGNSSGPNLNFRGYWDGNTQAHTNIIFYSKGLDQKEIKERLSSLKIITNLETNSGKNTAEHLIGDIVKFQYQGSHTLDITFLELADVIRAFKEGNLELAKTNIATEKYQLVGQKPTIYEVKANPGSFVMVYVYKDPDERETAYEELDYDTNKDFSQGLINNNYPLVYKHNAKNILICYLPKLTETKPHINFNEEELKKIKEIIFSEINEGKEIVYSGGSQHWDTNYIVKYYRHWWKDEKGTLKIDSYHYGFIELKYKGKDLSALKNVDYEYKGPTNGGKRTGHDLSKEGYTYSTLGGGNGAIPNPDAQYTMIINWNGQEETFHLNAVKSR